MYALVLPGVRVGVPRYEYCCEKCYGATLDRCTSVMRVERHHPAPKEACPQCGEMQT